MILPIVYIRNSKNMNRTDHIISEIKTFHRELMEPNQHAVKVKFKKMAKSPFNFYRGTAHLFYTDMKRYHSDFVNEKTGKVWIQGDLHIGNFGTYKDSNGCILYDVNDYDECYIAQFVWDIWRAAASIILIAREKQFTDVPERDFVEEFAKSFYEKIKQFAEDKSERSFKIDLSNSDGAVRKALGSAHSASRKDFLDRSTEMYRGVRRFKFHEPNVSLSSEIRNKMVSAFYEQYLPSIPLSKRYGINYYSIQDIDMIEVRGAGIGSAGQKMFSFLIKGETNSPDDDIIVAAKEAKPSVVATHLLSKPFPDGHIKNDALRTVLGQRAMQVNADPFAGCFEYNGKAYYLAELSPYEREINLTNIKTSKEFLMVLHQMGQATAKIHAISDRDADASLIPYSVDKEIAGVIAGKEDRFLNEICNFAMDYADIVENDYKVFLEAIERKEI